MSIQLEIFWQGSYLYRDWGIKGIHLQSTKANVSMIDLRLPDTQKQQLSINVMNKNTHLYTTHECVNCRVGVLYNMSISVLMMQKGQVAYYPIKINEMPTKLHLGERYQLSIEHEHKTGTFQTTLRQKVDEVMTQVVPKWLEEGLYLLEQGLEISGKNYALALAIERDPNNTAKDQSRRVSIIMAEIYRSFFAQVSGMKQYIEYLSIVGVFDKSPHTPERWHALEMKNHEKVEVK